MKDEIIIELSSRYSFDQTVELIREEALHTGWNVPAVHDLQQSLAKSGTHVRPVKVIEICKPEYSGQMLELSDERIMSVMMPCRISVYEKNDSNVYVSLLNGGKMAAAMPEPIARVMKAASDDTFEVVKVVSKH
jgi:uncharacterized protein (DUF302 family)